MIREDLLITLDAYHILSHDPHTDDIVRLHGWIIAGVEGFISKPGNIAEILGGPGQQREARVTKGQIEWEDEEKQ